ncbi:hypothetical protein NMS74_001309 [Vibrio cholerae]|nr:hypothetical protein [Vibrio cholerae]EGQ9645093.1 hypothetical protein [Vibrio cholerae]EJL6638890.1 hypothetical protein [Vibrio cholerae]
MSIKRLTEFKRSSESDLIKMIIILDKLGGKRVLSSSSKLRRYSKENLQSIFVEGVAFKLDIARDNLDNGRLSQYQESDLDDLLSEIIITLKKTENIEYTLSWAKNNDRALLFTLSIIRLVIKNHKQSISEINYEHIEKRKKAIDNASRFNLSLIRRCMESNYSELGINLRKYQLDSLFKIEEGESMYHDLLDITERYLILSEYKDTNWLERIIKDCHNEFKKLSIKKIESWDIVKTKNEDLINWSYENIKQKYDILHRMTPSNSSQKRLFILNYLDIMSLLSENTLLQRKNNNIGNLKKLFSRKKKELELEAEDDKGKKKIVIDDVYWEKLKFISGTNSIKKTLYKVIDEAEAKAKRKLDVINNEKE